MSWSQRDRAEAKQTKGPCAPHQQVGEQFTLLHLLAELLKPPPVAISEGLQAQRGAPHCGALGGQAPRAQRGPASQ